jgi:hypothetical protein
MDLDTDINKDIVAMYSGPRIKWLDMCKEVKELHLAGVRPTDIVNLLKAKYRLHTITRGRGKFIKFSRAKLNLRMVCSMINHYKRWDYEEV